MLMAFRWKDSKNLDLMPKIVRNEYVDIIAVQGLCVCLFVIVNAFKGSEDYSKVYRTNLMCISSRIRDIETLRRRLFAHAHIIERACITALFL